MNNLEAPTIVRSSTYQPNPFHLGDRIAERLDQTISNRQAYDIVYPTHEDYYKDKRFIVIDKNFEKVEDSLLNQLKSAIDSSIDYSSNSKLVHVENFDKSKVNLKGLDLQATAPMIQPSSVSTNYGNISQNDSKVKITSSDPYATIFGGRP